MGITDNMVNDAAQDRRRKVMRRALVCAAVLLSLTGCYSEEQSIRDKAKTVQACVDSGGEWHATPSWGESCHFDTRDRP